MRRTLLYGWDWAPFMAEQGPVCIFGYDGKIHPDRATPAQWRAFYEQQAKRKGTHSKEDWENLRHRIGRCMACGKTGVRLTKDHIVPISRGGCDCIENVQPLCQPCNSSKSNREWQ